MKLVHYTLFLVLCTGCTGDVFATDDAGVTELTTYPELPPRFSLPFDASKDAGEAGTQGDGETSEASACSSVTGYKSACASSTCFDVKTSTLTLTCDESSGACVSPYTFWLSCQSKNDCGGNDACCLYNAPLFDGGTCPAPFDARGTYSACGAAFQCPNVLCKTDAECGSGKTCEPVSPEPAGVTLGTWTLGVCH